MGSSDRYLDIAQRIGDGALIDWERESAAAPADEADLLMSLQTLARIGEVHRSSLAGVAPDQEAMAPQPLPEQVGPYRIRKLLGSGGLGLVYEAEQDDPPHTLALKVIREARVRDPDVIRRFEREARTLARLNHPSIAGIYESGRTRAGDHFIAMELVRGATLHDWQDSRQEQPNLSEKELRIRLDVFRKICDAVAYAHERSVIHRDLKPRNIMVQEERPGEDPQVKILDFGLAHAAFSSGMTEPGRVLGTLRYMSPEQTLGEPKDVDARTDVYSLGVILYELLTGTQPYDVHTGTLRERAQTIRSAPARSLEQAWGDVDVDPALEELIQRALRKDPADRYQTVAKLLEDLERYLSAKKRTRDSWWKRGPFWSLQVVAASSLLTGLQHFLRDG